MQITDKPIIVEHIINTSIENAWNAITRLVEMKQWYFQNIDSFIPEVGFETQFEVSVEDRIFTHLWKITEVIPNKKLTYNWKYKEYPGDSFVTFELIEDKNLVKLKLFVDVVEDFQEGIPEFSRESCINGWNYFIGLNLKKYLEKKSK
ncbi:MAG: SRPBCC domain-containing protein [Prolixibacteraceae bacterium]|jgi:uncharacterized protein YndB with AHSA1/START domain|nr:SRPBCC domain-containing protein [Prolixibacteraceae bacterium]MBT6765909.1 SRPBCC domain-containing protein [Prolixibacteraceae bacterium]MBT6998772.1 SRPBCC domain-containing protein [Prolixibacteraceae bacterium]MBT7393962.1 SRPBCC domain-containing protein [Prolixibacteraceae bacterium]